MFAHQFEKMITANTAMFQIFEVMKQAAATDDTHVLIVGESGVGKELIARGIHNLSRRKNKMFAPVACIDLPSNLLDGELFGFEKNAFIGANARKHGLLEIAHQGTLFLDEICELSPTLQADLIRVLEERRFRRIGGHEFININIRVISATNTNPDEAIENKVLCRELYSHLNAISIFVPPLRERKEDIALLARYFLGRFIAVNDIDSKTLTPEAIEALQEYHWPGNVRELQEVIARAATLSSDHVILPKDLPEAMK